MYWHVLALLNSSWVGKYLNESIIGGISVKRKPWTGSSYWILTSDYGRLTANLVYLSIIHFYTVLYLIRLEKRTCVSQLWHRAIGKRQKLILYFKELVRLCFVQRSESDISDICLKSLQTPMIVCQNCCWKATANKKTKACPWKWTHKVSCLIIISSHSTF